MGWKTYDMIDGLPGIMNLAAASGENLGSVSDIVTDSLTAFGLKAKDSAHFADVLAKASSSSNTNVGLMGSTFQYVAPVAGALGYKVEDCAVAIGLMANAGIKGEKSGTALRTLFTNLVKPTDTVAGAMKRLKIEASNADGTMKPLRQLLNEMRSSFSGLTEEQKASEAAALAGKEAMSGLLSVVNASDEDFNNLTAAIDNSDGSAKDMADIMNDNLNGSLTLLGSALEGAGIAFYEKFSAPAKEVVDNVAKWFGDLTVNLGNGELDNTLSLIGSSLTAVGTGLLVFNVVSVITNFIGVMNGTATAIGLVAKAQAILNAVMNISPIGWFVIIITAVIAGLIVLWNTNEGFRNFIIGAWNSILAVGKSVWEWLVNFFTVSIPTAFQTVMNFFIAIPEWFASLWNSINQAFLYGWQVIVDFFVVSIPFWIDQICNWFNELPNRLGYALGYALVSIIKWGMDTWNYLATNVPIWIENIVKFFSELPEKLWKWLVTAYNNIVTWGIQMCDNMVSSASNSINAVVQWFSMLPGRIWGWLINAISNVISFANSLGSAATQAGSNMVSNIINAVSNLPSEMASIGSNIVRGVWNGITGMGRWISDKVSGFFGGIVDGAKDALGIHSPSRVFRDQIGKYMAQGVGVGFENESKNIQSDMKDSLTELTAKMQATVNCETAKTTSTVTAKNNSYNNKDNNTASATMENKSVIEVPVIIEGEKVAKATAPYSDKISGQRLNLTERGLIL